jgi:hypothetical protein
MPAVCEVVQGDQSSVTHVLVHETFHLHSGQHWYRRILLAVKQVAAAARRLDVLPLIRQGRGPVHSAACPSLYSHGVPVTLACAYALDFSVSRSR